LQLTIYRIIKRLQLSKKQTQQIKYC